MLDAPFVQSVLHSSDFSEASHTAFMHALAVVLYRRARFEIVHVVSQSEDVHDWSESPGVRATLGRWGVLEPGSPRSALRDKLSLDVAKINVRGADPRKAILDILKVDAVDLLVLSTKGREGLPRWLKPSLAEEVARESKTMTLFVPEGVDGFVSADDGRIALRRILVPVDARPNPLQAVTYAARAAVMSHESPVEIVLLHVNGGSKPPWPNLPELETCTWRTIEREGDVVRQVVKAAGELSADLIVMATEGRKGVLGMLRGSVTEQVLRQASCPVLAVPADKT